MDININISLVKEEITKISEQKKELETILDDIDKKVEILKEQWDSATSEEVYTYYEDFKKFYKDIVTSLESDIDFLNDTVDGYETSNDNSNKEIDNKLTE